MDPPEGEGFDRTCLLDDDVLFAILVGFNANRRPHLSLRWRSMAAAVCRRWRGLMQRASPKPKPGQLVFEGARFTEASLAAGRVVHASALVAVAERLGAESTVAMVRSIRGTDATDAIAVLAAADCPNCVLLREAIAAASATMGDGDWAEALGRFHSYYLWLFDGHRKRWHWGTDGAQSLPACYALHAAARVGSTRSARVVLPLSDVHCVGSAAVTAAHGDHRDLVALLLGEAGPLSHERARAVWTAVGRRGATRTADFLVGTVEADPDRYPLRAPASFSFPHGTPSWQDVRHHSPWLREAAFGDHPGLLAFCARLGIPYDESELLGVALRTGSLRFCHALVAAHVTLRDRAPCAMARALWPDRPARGLPARVNPHRSARWLLAQPWFAMRTGEECAMLVEAALSHAPAKRDAATAARLLLAAMKRWPRCALAAFAQGHAHLASAVVAKCIIDGRSPKNAGAVLIGVGRLRREAPPDAPRVALIPIDPWRCVVASRPPTPRRRVPPPVASGPAPAGPVLRTRRALPPHGPRAKLPPACPPCGLPRGARVLVPAGERRRRPADALARGGRRDRVVPQTLPRCRRRHVGWRHISPAGHDTVHVAVVPQAQAFSPLRISSSGQFTLKI